MQHCRALTKTQLAYAFAKSLKLNAHKSKRYATTEKMLIECHVQISMRGPQTLSELSTSIGMRKSALERQLTDCPHFVEHKGKWHHHSHVED